MSRRTGELVLNLFFASSGYHNGAWRMPDSRSDELLSLNLTADIARQAERAKLHSIFIADLLTAGPVPGKQPRVHELEPLTSLAAISAVTTHIGLIGTASTSFNEPYNVARLFSSLDHLSAGRAGWNIVTSFMGGENFTAGLSEHEERYRRANEFVEVVTRLWDSWDEDAVVNDKQNGTWARPDRIHSLDFKGEYFNVRGPLNLARSPQRWPLLVQAGMSASGLGLAARYGEMVYTVQTELEGAQAFYAELKQMVAANERRPESLLVLPGLMPIIGSTEAEAQELQRELAEYVDLEAGRASLKARFAVPLDSLPLDEPVPADLLPDPDQVEGHRSRHRYFHDLAMEGKTLRQLIKIFAASTGHMVVCGTAEQVAEKMQEWFNGHACDGFNLEMAYVPGSLDSIENELVPALQNRGIFRDEFGGGTLREELGLLDPPVRADRR